MKNNIIKYMACAAMALGLAATVQAAQITGGISMSGGPITTDTGNLLTATAITGFGTVVVSSVSPVGTYSSVPLLTSVATAGFTFLPSLPTAIRIWRFDIGSTAYWFDLSSIQAVTQGLDVNGNAELDIVGRGTLDVTGFDPTQGSYKLTANSASASFSFSSSNGAMVPDGGVTVMLLGAALSGLALIRRKLA
jgi:hypothetical protein